MATRRIPASAVVRHFQGHEQEDWAIPEVFFQGSDDELGMEDFLSSSDEKQTGKFSSEFIMIICKTT